MKEIELSKGKIALIDDEDYDNLNQYNWFASKAKNSTDNWYAATHVYKNDKRTTIFMHNLLLGIKGLDHKDGNGLNNQRYNIREANASQNMHNRRKLVIGYSKYKGVTWSKDKNRYRAYIYYDTKLHSLGTFDSEIEAAKAYDKEALLRFGEFARVNFPLDILEKEV